jgi:hypothetical protein
VFALLCTVLQSVLWLAQDARGLYLVVLWSKVLTAFLLRSGSNQAWFVVFVLHQSHHACVRECEVALADEHSHVRSTSHIGEMREW